ncbi:MAG TPA: GH32 C-terminal domain-containing protein, partial [Actinomycetales bacterium]|nr:GH32 C-terminal domain-containing protein [Actinomycetales bacterium]
VNINPGGIAGGSAAQYFVGDFDGKRFTADDDGSYTPPTGAVVQGFEQAGYGSWTVSGKAFGTGPAFGSLPGQSDVAGVEGRGHASSFHDGDASTGLLTSPTFTVSTPYLNFKVGGGRHPHDPDAALDPPTPTGTVLADFEGPDYGAWQATGEAFGAGPAAGRLGDQLEVSGWLGKGLVNTFLRSERTGGNGDSTVGTLTSPSFPISKDHINFLIGGGNHPMSSDAPTAVELVVDGRVVRSATGKDSEALNWASWDVQELAGKTAQIRVLDQNTGGWGHILLDQVLLSDTAAHARSTETSVNLLVGGRVVQSATGSDSESLDWASFDLRPYVGQPARVQIVDRNTAGWGHILADQFVAAKSPALSTVQRASWVDFGKDYYAAVSWENVPNGKRYMIGWMNNWQYGGSIPTSPWRSAMSVPREMGLRTIDGRIRLVQRPVRTLQSLRTGRPVTARRVPLHPGSVPLADGKALDIQATFSVRGADRVGLEVRAGSGQRTTVGYDVTSQEVYVDRRASGDVGFSGDFPGVQRAPLPMKNGKVHLRVLVDWSSVEVFGGRSGQAVITDQVFPAPSARAVRAFTAGGSARLDRLRVWRMGSYRR